MNTLLSFFKLISRNYNILQYKSYIVCIKILKIQYNGK